MCIRLCSHKISSPAFKEEVTKFLLLEALLILVLRLLEMNGLYCRVDLTPWNKIKLARHYYEIIAVDKRLQRVER